MKTLVPTPVLILLTSQLMLRFSGFRKCGKGKKEKGGLDLTLKRPLLWVISTPIIRNV
jgi:hypothetical protein